MSAGLTEAPATAAALVRSALERPGTLAGLGCAKAGGGVAGAVAALASACTESCRGGCSICGIPESRAARHLLQLMMERLFMQTPPFTTLSSFFCSAAAHRTVGW